MKRIVKSVAHEKFPAAVFVVLIAIAGLIYLNTSSAATFVTGSEAEAGTRSTNATLTTDSTASGGSAVKFGAVTSSGGGVCNNPIGSVQNRDAITMPGFNGQMSVRNEAWNDNHGPQTTYACSEQSWYSMSNQPDEGGQVMTYPDSLYTISGSKTINQYTSATSTFGEAYQAQGNWDAGYDVWANDFDPNTEVMIWNEWNGAQGYWPSQATIAVSLGGVPYHFYKNGTELMFFRDTQVKSGSVDILSAWKWLLSKNYLKTTDVPTDIEYGVEICATVGTQRFDTTGFTVSIQ